MPMSFYEFADNLTEVEFSKAMVEAHEIYHQGALDMEYYWWRRFWMSTIYPNTKVGDYSQFVRPLCQLFMQPHRNDNRGWCPFCPVKLYFGVDCCSTFKELNRFNEHILTHEFDDELCPECRTLARKVVEVIKKVRK